MYEFKCDQEALKKAIRIAGGMQPLAKKIGVSYQAILNWKSERTKMNPIRCVKIEEATEGIVKRSDILPDYPWEKFK